MKIAHVITRMIIGGAQENTLLSCMGQVANGHDVTLITGPTSGPEGTLLDKQDTTGLKLIELPSLVREISPAKEWEAYKELRKIFESERYDIVHTHASKAGIIGRAAAWKEGVNGVIHTVHGPPFHRYEKVWKNNIYIAAEKFAVKRCHKMLCVADAMTQQYLEAGVGKAEMYRTVHSGMNLEQYLTDDGSLRARVRTELDLPEDAVVIVKVARLFELKGHDYLIEAARMLKESGVEAYFVLVGDGLLRTQIAQELEKLGLLDNFRFTGLVPPAAVAQYVHAADILCHLSLREGLPRAVVQGLAAAKPAVAFALDGAPEVVLPGETGYLCEPMNKQDVFKALSELCASADLRKGLGLKGRELVSRLFSTQRMVDQLEEVYSEVLKKS
jgi:glycosyltransferase involved in cell wall biosynthesis